MPNDITIAAARPPLTSPSTLATRSNTASFRSQSTSPILTNEIVELIVGLSQRLLPGKFYLPGADPTVSHPLNVLSRSVMTTPTKIALMLFPTVTLTMAISLEGNAPQLLDMMVYLSAAPYRRPLAHNAWFVADAAEKGALAVLQWWFDHKDLVPVVCRVDETVMESASRAGQVHVLDWCLEHGLRLPADSLESIWSTKSTAILDWFLAHGLAQEYDEATMDGASEFGAVAVLEWWKSSGLPLKYSHRALELAIMGKHRCVLDWWIDSGLKLYCNELELTRCAIRAGDLFALEWLAKTNMLLVDRSLLSDVFSANDIRVIEWCMDRFRMQPPLLDTDMDLWTRASSHASTVALNLATRLGFKLSQMCNISPCLEAAARLESFDVLDWWLLKRPTLSAAYFESAFNAAVATGHVSVLDWVKQHGYFVQDKEPDMPSLTLAAMGGHIDVLKWFAQHWRCRRGSPARNAFASSVFLAAAEHGHFDIVHWWREKGFHIPDFVTADCPGRQAFTAAADRGHGAMLKLWVDAKMQELDQDLVYDLPPSLVKRVLFSLLRSPKTDSFAYLKWWIKVFGCRSHTWCVEMVTEASTLNKVHVLDWMLKSQLLDSKYAYNGLGFAAQQVRVDVMDWWVANANKLTVALRPHDCFETERDSEIHLACHWLAHNASKLKLEPCEIGPHGLAALMDRMLRLGVFTVPKTYSVHDEASEAGSVDTLSWWCAMDLAEKKDKHYSEAAVDGKFGTIRSRVAVVV